MADCVGAAYERTASSHHGAHRYIPIHTRQNLVPLTQKRLGHSGEVFATRFDPTGQHIASGSMDRNIRMYTDGHQRDVRLWLRRINSFVADVRSM